MKDYEKIALLEKKKFQLQEMFNQHRADLAGWDHRMVVEEQRFKEFKANYNAIATKKQELFARVKKELADIEKKLGTSKEEQIKSAHIKSGDAQCQYCFHWFNKNGLASHEKACGMNPEVQAKKPEKALEKITDMVENGDHMELEDDQLDMLKEAKALIESKLAAINAKQKARTKVKEPEEPEVIDDGGDLPQ